jgi:hypothetical protein
MSILVVSILVSRNLFKYQTLNTNLLITNILKYSQTGHFGVLWAIHRAY